MELRVLRYFLAVCEEKNIETVKKSRRRTWCNPVLPRASRNHVNPGRLLSSRTC